MGKTRIVSIDPALKTSLEERGCASSPFRCRRLPANVTFVEKTEKTHGFSRGMNR
jgi:hypothetical protein